MHQQRLFPEECVSLMCLVTPMALSHSERSPLVLHSGKSKIALHSGGPRIALHSERKNVFHSGFLFRLWRLGSYFLDSKKISRCYSFYK